jgi:hypothetical protein
VAGVAGSIYALATRCKSFLTSPDPSMEGAIPPPRDLTRLGGRTVPLSGAAGLGVHPGILAPTYRGEPGRPKADRSSTRIPARKSTDLPTKFAVAIRGLLRGLPGYWDAFTNHPHERCLGYSRLAPEGERKEEVGNSGIRMLPTSPGSHSSWSIELDATCGKKVSRFLQGARFLLDPGSCGGF